MKRENIKRAKEIDLQLERIDDTKKEGSIVIGCSNLQIKGAKTSDRLVQDFLELRGFSETESKNIKDLIYGMASRTIEIELIKKEKELLKELKNID